MESNLLQASQEGNVNIVKEIIESGQANINSKERIEIQNSFI